MKDPAAQELGRIRWRKATAEHRAALPAYGKLGGRPRLPAHPYDARCRCRACQEHGTVEPIGFARCSNCGERVQPGDRCATCGMLD